MWCGCKGGCTITFRSVVTVADVSVDLAALSSASAASKSMRSTSSAIMAPPQPWDARNDLPTQGRGRHKSAPRFLKEKAAQNADSERTAVQ